MKVKTKNRIKAAFIRVGDLFAIALIFFVFYLAVGTYGQVKGESGYRHGYVDGLNARKKPSISTTLPSGDLEAISFAESTNTGNF